MTIRLTRRAFTNAAMAGSVSAGLPLARARAQPATPEAPATATPRAALDHALSGLPGVVQDLMDQTGVPGVAVSVVSNDELAYAAGFGEREIGTGAKVGPDTVFQIASVSKPISSTIIAAAMNDGAFDWKTPVARLDPRFALSAPWITANVSLEDLFSHRSGLPEHAGDLLEDLGGTREEVLHALRFIKPAGDFRASYAYTNFGLTAAAEAVAQSMETPWEDLGDDYLFRPAGMTRTSFRFSDFIEHDDRAVGHVERDGAWVHAFDREPDAQSPAGGVSSTVNDLARWMRLQLGGGVLDGTPIADSTALGYTHLPHAISTMPAPPYGTMPGFYGLGWNVGYDPGQNVTLSHSGAFAYGAATAVFLWPAEGIGIAVLTNSAPVGLPESICLSFHDLIRAGTVQNDYLAIIRPIIEAQAEPQYGFATATPPASPEPASPLELYSGTYTNDVFGDLDIAVEGDLLEMTLGPRLMQFPLTHFSRDVFTYQPIGENAGPASAVTFTMSAAGPASQVVIENLDIYGAGTFVRA